MWLLLSSEIQNELWVTRDHQFSMKRNKSLRSDLHILSQSHFKNMCDQITIGYSDASSFAFDHYNDVIERDGVSDNQPHDCLLNRLFRHKSKKTSRLRVIGFCAGNSPETGDFPAQRTSNAGNGSIWWRHHAKCQTSKNVCSSLPYMSKSSLDVEFLSAYAVKTACLFMVKRELIATRLLDWFGIQQIRWHAIWH